jgi:hypothetical protein
MTEQEIVISDQAYAAAYEVCGASRPQIKRAVKAAVPVVVGDELEYWHSRLFAARLLESSGHGSQGCSVEDVLLEMRDEVARLRGLTDVI